jgi:hypothetical protein
LEKVNRCRAFPGRSTSTYGCAGRPSRAAPTPLPTLPARDVLWTTGAITTTTTDASHTGSPGGCSYRRRDSRLTYSSGALFLNTGTGEVARGSFLIYLAAPKLTGWYSARAPPGQYGLNPPHAQNSQDRHQRSRLQQFREGRIDRGRDCQLAPQRLLGNAGRGLQCPCPLAMLLAAGGLGAQSLLVDGRGEVTGGLRATLGGGVRSEATSFASPTVPSGNACRG